jgi:hypothetical protein
VISAQYGLNSNVEDVAAAVRYLGQVSNPILLVGHSTRCWPWTRRRTGRGAAWSG